MKVFIFALAIFTLLAVGMFFNVRYLTNTLGEIRESVAAIPRPASGENNLSLQAEKLQAVRAHWIDQYRFISLTVNHHDLMETETQFAAAIGAAKAGTRENYLVALSQLDYALSHLTEMARITLGNVI